MSNREAGIGLQGNPPKRWGRDCISGPVKSNLFGVVELIIILFSFNSACGIDIIGSNSLPQPEAKEWIRVSADGKWLDLGDRELYKYNPLNNTITETFTFTNKYGEETRAFYSSFGKWNSKVQIARTLYDPDFEEYSTNGAYRYRHVYFYRIDDEGASFLGQSNDEWNVEYPRPTSTEGLWTATCQDYGSWLIQSDYNQNWQFCYFEPDNPDPILYPQYVSGDGVSPSPLIISTNSQGLYFIEVQTMDNSRPGQDYWYLFKKVLSPFAEQAKLVTSLAPDDIYQVGHNREILYSQALNSFLYYKREKTSEYDYWSALATIDISKPEISAGIVSRTELLIDHTSHVILADDEGRTALARVYDENSGADQPSTTLILFNLVTGEVIRELYTSDGFIWDYASDVNKVFIADDNKNLNCEIEGQCYESIITIINISTGERSEILMEF